MRISVILGKRGYQIELERVYEAISYFEKALWPVRLSLAEAPAASATSDLTRCFERRLLSETDPARITSYPSACSVVPGLTNRQRELCIRHPDTMKYLIDGLRMAISECQNAFRNQVWNCTLTVPGVGTTPLKIASKESAFVYAIASAGVSHSLAKACAK
ncbi:hypothetical protein ANCDUO_23933, partial [Ancylostoma duodenale]